MDAPTDIVGYNPTRDAGDCVWDSAAAEWVCNFFPACLTHVKGFTGPFDLQPWQRDILGTLFGWRRKDGTRRYREALIAVPRKNGKTAICAGLGLYLLECDGETGPEVYCAAGSQPQATLVFDPAASMVRSSAKMSAFLTVHDSTKRIVSHRRNGFLRAIPAEAALSHGFNASGVIFDEIHTQPNRDLYDVLKTSQGARLESARLRKAGGPLFVSITTAGHNRHSICWEVWDYARKVRDGVIVDPSFLPVIYELRDNEPWDDPAVWRRVNPNLGVSISETFLDEEFRRAKEVPAYENTFRNLYLNQWTEQAVRWLPMEKWDQCGDEPGDLTGRECWAGLDLSSTRDLSALVLAFRVGDKVYLEPHFWIPKESSINRSLRDRVPYEQWVRDGWIVATPGNTIDYDFIHETIRELSRKYRIRQIAYDRWNASQLVTNLQKENAPVAEFGQGFASMSAPSKELERLVVECELMHGANPVLRWMASNVAAKIDAAGNIKPDKEASSDRIDGIVAAIMAIAMLTTDDRRASPYLGRGIRTT